MSSNELGRSYKKGEIIVQQGEVGDCMYVIQQGQVEIIVEQEGRSIPLAIRTEGDIFGEMAIFEGEVRMATVKALDNVRVLTVDKRNLLRRISEDPSLAFNMIEVLSRRVRNLSSRVAAFKSENR